MPPALVLLLASRRSQHE